MAKVKTRAKVNVEDRVGGEGVTPPGRGVAEHTQGPGMAVLNTFQSMVCAVGHVMPHPTSETLSLEDQTGVQEPVSPSKQNCCKSPRCWLREMR